MSYLIVADWDTNLRPTRVNQKKNRADAQALVDRLINDMPAGKEAPNAFYVPYPSGGDVSHMVVDPALKTVTYDTAGEVAAKAMADWKVQIAASEISRDLENIIAAMDAPSRARIDTVTLDKYNAKITLRSKKP